MGGFEVAGVNQQFAITDHARRNVPVRDESGTEAMLQVLARRLNQLPLLGGMRLERFAHGLVGQLETQHGTVHDDLRMLHAQHLRQLGGDPVKLAYQGFELLCHEGALNLRR